MITRRSFLKVLSAFAVLPIPKFLRAEEKPKIVTDIEKKPNGVTHYKVHGRPHVLIDENHAFFERVTRPGIRDQIKEGEEIFVPTFEIASNPTIRLSEIKARRFYIVDGEQPPEWMRRSNGSFYP